MFGATSLGSIDEEEGGPPYYMWSCQKKLFCLMNECVILLKFHMQDPKPNRFVKNSGNGTW